MEKEIRTITASGLVVERRDKESPPVIKGYAAVFNKDSENLGGFVERIAPGAFRKALKTSDTRALFNHDANMPLGRVSAGTLRLKEDDKGLAMEIDPPDTQYARDLMVSIERRDVREQSFGFIIAEGGDKWTDTDKTIAKRTINEISEVFDVSPVTFPAYPDTSVALRSLDKIKKDAATSATHTGATARRLKHFDIHRKASRRIKS